MAESNTVFTEKLYSPVFVQTLDMELDDDDDYYNDELYPISQETAKDYVHEIGTAPAQERSDLDEARGLMAYYRSADSEVDKHVDEKVHSLFVDVEVHEGKLWGVATLELTAPLNQFEYDRLKDYLSGQYSDGFGEGLGQHAITVGDEELYVSLWSSDDGFFIDTQQEFTARGLLIDQKPSLKDTLKQNAERSKAQFGEPAPTKDKGAPSL